MPLLEVGMAELRLASSPDVLVTRGLGSCLGIVLYCEKEKTGSLAHAMLPCMENSRIKTNPAKFVDSAIDVMLGRLKRRGCDVDKVWAKMFGGAHMFSSVPADSPFNVGNKNIVAAREVFKSLNIRVMSEDLGKNYGRTIFFDLNTGKVTLKTMFHGEQEL